MTKVRGVVLKTIIKFILVLMTLFFSSCVSRSDYDKLKNENDSLRIELDECQYGEEKIVGKIENAYKEKDYQLVRVNINDLFEKHPESTNMDKYKKILKKIEKEETTKKENERIQKENERVKKEAEQRELIRLAKLDDTGMWRIRYYADDFGQSTDQKYITHSERIRGRFSNTATADSPLAVIFSVSSRDYINIYLYEYAGDVPVRSIGGGKYDVLIEDKDGKRLRLLAHNGGNCIFFDKKEYSQSLHDVLLRGGNIKFRINEDNYTTKYSFDIGNADGYKNAYRKLLEK